MKISQPRPIQRTERYVAIPCSGEDRVETGKNHVYRILDFEHPSGRVTYRGWLTRERAQELFGEKSIYFSNSHGLCPHCDISLEDIV